MLRKLESTSKQMISFKEELFILDRTVGSKKADFNALTNHLKDTKNNNLASVLDFDLLRELNIVANIRESYSKNENKPIIEIAKENNVQIHEIRLIINKYELGKQSDTIGQKGPINYNEIQEYINNNVTDIEKVVNKYGLTMYQGLLLVKNGVIKNVDLPKNYKHFKYTRAVMNATELPSKPRSFYKNFISVKNTYSMLVKTNQIIDILEVRDDINSKMYQQVIDTKGIYDAYQLAEAMKHDLEYILELRNKGLLVFNSSRKVGLEVNTEIAANKLPGVLKEHKDVPTKKDVLKPKQVQGLQTKTKVKSKVEVESEVITEVKQSQYVDIFKLEDKKDIELLNKVTNLKALQRDVNKLKDETLFSIAKKYSIMLNELYRLGKLGIINLEYKSDKFEEINIVVEALNDESVAEYLESESVSKYYVENLKLNAEHLIK